MAEYYYTVASLPMLTINQDPPITIDYFTETCRYTMSEQDFRTLMTAEIAPVNPSTQKTIEMWQNWERSLRNELARIRSQKTGIDAERYLREGDTSTGVFDAAREAAGAVNPQAGEDILDNARWRYLDELESSHNFDLTKLIVYYLKLQIAERKKSMNTENGSEKYREIYNGITDKIHQSYDGEL